MRSRSPPAIEVAVIAAVAYNQVIGARGTMPWHIPDDLRRFSALTRGHSVIMGRRTWETLLCPLPDRQNIVLSHCATYRKAGVIVANSLLEALELATWPTPVFVIGGERPYAEAMATIASTLYITEVHAKFDGDVFFPIIDQSVWSRQATRPGKPEGPDSPAFQFVSYRRLTSLGCFSGRNPVPEAVS